MYVQILVTTKTSCIEGEPPIVLYILNSFMVSLFSPNHS